MPKDAQRNFGSITILNETISRCRTPFLVVYFVKRVSYFNLYKLKTFTEREGEPLITIHIPIFLKQHMF